MKKAILWDMDGTLVDSEPAHHEAFNDVAAEVGVVVPLKFHLENTGTTLENVYHRFAEFSGTDMDYNSWRTKKIEAFKHHGQDITRCEPLASLAENLSKRNIPMCIVSNSSREELEFSLVTTGLDKVIPNYVCRNDVKNPKPDPEIYLLGAAKLGVKPADCLVVEDSLPGAKAGINAKMHVLYHPQHDIADESQLPKGLHYIPHNQSPVAYIKNFLEKG
ncbi:MAG: HAD family hydrolase [Alphaproteobacteria bacterium]